jgi:hypothetical protein
VIGDDRSEPIEKPSLNELLCARSLNGCVSRQDVQGFRPAHLSQPGSLSWCTARNRRTSRMGLVERFIEWLDQSQPACSPQISPIFSSFRIAAFVIAGERGTNCFLHRPYNFGVFQR